MSNYAKWIGGGLGWMYGGPIGAFFGYQIGKYISRNFQSKETSFEMSEATHGQFSGAKQQQKPANDYLYKNQ